MSAAGAPMTPVDYRGLAADLAAERAAVQSFIDVLEKEQEALLHGDTDRLGAGVQDKPGLLVTLSQLTERRGRFLAAQALAPDRRGMEAWFAAHPGATDALKEWHELLRLTHRARQLNRTNGIVIEAALRANQQAFSALVSAARMSSLYGPEGETVRTQGPRSLGAA